MLLSYHIASITEAPQLKKAVSCDTTCHPIAVGISQPSGCVSIIRAGCPTTDTGKLFNYLYVGVNRPYIGIHQGCSSGPAQSLSVQSKGKHGAQFSDLQPQQPQCLLTMEDLLLPTQRGMQCSGVLHALAKQDAILLPPTPFLHSHEKKLPRSNHCCIKK